MKLQLPKSAPLVVEFDGVDYPVNRPTVGAVQEFEAAGQRLKEEGSGGGVALVVNMLVQCGLPRAVVESMDPSQVEAVIEFLTQQKKS